MKPALAVNIAGQIACLQGALPDIRREISRPAARVDFP